MENIDCVPHVEHKDYQNNRCANLSDNDLILGMVEAFKRDACNALHHTAVIGHLSTDECRMFRYVSGSDIYMSDHFNMRWFKEWCEQNRPQVLKRLYSLKIFW